MRPAVERVEVDSVTDLRARRALRGFPTDAEEVVDVSVVLGTRALATRDEEEARFVFVAVVAVASTRLWSIGDAVVRRAAHRATD